MSFSLHTRTDKLKRPFFQEEKAFGLCLFGTITETQKGNIQFEVQHAVESVSVSVNAWKAHLLRTINQEKAKIEVLSGLDIRSAMLVLDWAMKFLPLKFRD